MDKEKLTYYTHKACLLKPGIPELGKKIVAIIDDDVTHLRFLRGWLNAEIDTNTRWSLVHGEFILSVSLSRGENKVDYNLKLPLHMIRTIIQTLLFIIAVCDERQRIILYFTPKGIRDLRKFYDIKVNVERIIKNKEIPAPVGWHLN